MLEFKYLEADKFQSGDKYLMFTNLNQVHLVTVSEDNRWFDDPHGTKCSTVKVFPLKELQPEINNLTYWQKLAEAALAYIEEISTNSELDTEEKRRRLDSWKKLQIIKSKQYCTCEAPLVRFDGEEYCGCCQKGVL